MTGIVIAIDGPSGSGKSTISKRVASDLGLSYLDTGAMYRAATWWCLDQGIPLDDADAVADAVAEMPLAMGVDPSAPAVRVGRTDITAAIRGTEIATAVSKVATNIPVRGELRRLQRAIIQHETGLSGWSQGRGIVAEGRDITTVVVPDAHVRILLTASEEARLARRAREVHGRADADAIAATTDQVLRRDRDDSTVSSFLTASDGVTTVDSSALTLDQTVDVVRGLIEEVRA
jgi:cytidylate kinase